MTDADRSGTRSRLFWLALGLYTAVAVVLLLLGLLPAVARASPTVLRAFAAWGRGTNFVAQVARAVPQAAADGWRYSHLAVDYTLSAVNIALGLFLVSLRPRDRVARLLAFGMIGTAAAFNIQSHAILVELARPGLLSLPGIIASDFHTSLHGISGLAYIHALLLFPDGRLRPPWAKWPLRVSYVLLATPLALQASVLFALPATLGAHMPNTVTFSAITELDSSWMVLSFGMLIPIVGFYSQASRYRFALNATERRQSRLLMLALGLALAAGVAFVALSLGLRAPATLVARGVGRGGIDELIFRVFPPFFVVLPLALFAALVKFRLWDVDRVITRTVLYGSVTALLGAGYVATVFVLDLLFRSVTGHSDLTVAVSTLLMAALFRPVRRRIQDVVDRRFNRAHYDAVRTVEAFARRLRDQTDIDTMTVELRDVVTRTMEPMTVSLWLRFGSEVQ